MPRREPASYSYRELKVRMAHVEGAQSRQRGDGKINGRFFKLLMHGMNVDSHPSCLLYLFKDGSACCDCVMCFITPQIPSGVACLIKKKVRVR